MVTIDNMQHPESLRFSNFSRMHCGLLQGEDGRGYKVAKVPSQEALFSVL
jgi:hypothetical protein